MLAATYNAAGEVIAVIIDGTAYSEAELLTLRARLARAEVLNDAQAATIAELRAQVNGLLGLLDRPRERPPGV